MIEWFTLGWQVEILGILILIYALFLFLRVVLKMADTELRKSSVWIFFAIILKIITSVVIGSFVTMEIDYRAALWLIPISLDLITTFLLIIGAEKIYTAMKMAE